MKYEFRGKDFGGVWQEGSLMEFEDGACAILSPTGYNEVTRNNVHPETVGQYTGLTDKNGKKIFEGDICRDIKTGEVVSVKWHGTFSGFVWSRRKEDSHLCDFGELFRAFDKYEIIGNIHDNPELMGGNENE